MDGQSLNDVQCADGGRMIELYKEEGFGQFTLRIIPPGAVVGNHRHLLKNEKWWIFGKAMVFLGLPDGTKEVYNLTTQHDTPVIKVPAGTGHRIENIGDEDVRLFFYSDRIYNPDELDKEPWEW